MGNNLSWVISEFSSSEKNAFRTKFNTQNQRFGWNDDQNYLLIERHVIFNGAKDWVLAKYDDFIQNSILAKNEMNASMPNFIHDHYVDYLMSQISSSIDQLSYPQIKYKAEDIPLVKNSEDGLRKWLLIGNLKGKLCIEYNRDIFVRFSFKVVVYSTPIDDDDELGINECKNNNNNKQPAAKVNINNDGDDDDDDDDTDDTDEVINVFDLSNDLEGNDTNMNANLRLSFLSNLFKSNEKTKEQKKLKKVNEKKEQKKLKKEKERREREKTEQEIAKRRRQKIQKKKHIKAKPKISAADINQKQLKREEKRRKKEEIEKQQKELEVMIKLEQHFKDKDEELENIKHSEEEKDDELKTDQTFEIGSMIQFNSEPDNSDTEAHIHQGKILAINKNKLNVKLSDGISKNYSFDKIKIVNKTDAETYCAEQGWKKCPNVDCGIYIERVYGCKHMKCTNCDTELCDVCGKQIDPPNWKKHFLPPNKCRLWDDLDDLLENDNDDIKVDDKVAKPDDGMKANMNFDVFEEGDMYHNETDQHLALFNEDIIGQLKKIGLADRETIIFAMKQVANKNDINAVANYLMLQNQQIETNTARTSDFKQIDRIEESIKSLQSDDDKVKQQIQHLQNQLNQLKAQKVDNNNYNAKQDSVNENIIQQLMDFGLGNRNQIIFAMKMVENKNDVNLIANYLMMTTDNITETNETALIN